MDIPGGLTFPLYAGSGLGNAVTLATTGEDDTASLSSPQTTGSVYSSFMLNVVNPQLGGDYFYALRTSGGALDSRVFIRELTPTTFGIGMQKATGSDTVYTGSYNILTTYLVIVKYTFVAGALNDQMSLFIYDSSSPPPAFEPAPTVGPYTFLTGTDAANLSQVALRQGSVSVSPNLIIDGIVVDLVWNNNVLPVELSSFTSTITGRDVLLNWTTTAEINNFGFDLERSISNDEWSKIGFIAGNGTSVVTNSYTFKDARLTSGQYNYRLKQIDYNGNSEYFNLANEVNIGIPVQYNLSQNYPNPFNPSTSIDFELPIDSKVSIQLFDVSGRQLKVLINEVRSAGYHTLKFNASELVSGIYFYKISATSNENTYVSVKKMNLIK